MLVQEIYNALEFDQLRKLAVLHSNPALRYLILKKKIDNIKDGVEVTIFLQIDQYPEFKNKCALIYRHWLGLDIKYQQTYEMLEGVFRQMIYQKIKWQPTQEDQILQQQIKKLNQIYYQEEKIKNRYEQIVALFQFEKKAIDQKQSDKKQKQIQKELESKQVSKVHKQQLKKTKDFSQDSSEYIDKNDSSFSINDSDYKSINEDKQYKHCKYQPPSQEDQFQQPNYCFYDLRSQKHKTNQVYFDATSQCANCILLQLETPTKQYCDNCKQSQKQMELFCKSVEKKRTQKESISSECQVSSQLETELKQMGEHLNEIPFQK